MSLLKPLQKATGCKPKAGEDRQEYLVCLVTAVSEMSEDDWAKLPDDSQDWVNDAITAIKDKTAVVDPAETAEAKPPKPAKKSKPAKAEEAEEAEEEEAAEEKPAKKPKPAKVEDEEDEKPAKEAKPAKATKASTPSAADKFRLAYLKVLIKGEAPKPQELVTKLGLELNDHYVTGMAYDLRKTVDALRKAELLKED